MMLFEDTPRALPPQADGAKAPYIRVQRTKAERRANRLAGKAERRRAANGAAATIKRMK